MIKSSLKLCFQLCLAIISTWMKVDCATLYGGYQWQHHQNIAANATLAPIACNGAQLDYNLIVKNRNIIDEHCSAYKSAYEASLLDHKIPKIQIPALCFYIDDMNLMINVNFDCEAALASIGSNSVFAIDDASQSSSSNQAVIGRKSTVFGSVVLIPGLAGSRLQAKLENVTKVNFACKKDSDWTDVWLRVSLLLPFKFDCWIDNMVLEYDQVTGTTYDRPGVTIRAPDFGSVKSVEHLDLKHTNQSGYFAAIIDRLAHLGYEKDRTILAAPYDFRKAPNELGMYFKKLTRLVERAVSFGYGRPTTLICHSMGCLNTLVFLREKTPFWRSQHIKRLIALASPWGGSIKSAKALVAGDNLDLPFISESKLREAVRSFPSVAFLLPNPDAIDPNGPFVKAKQYVLIQSPEKNYTASDYEQLFNDLNLTNVRDMWKANNKLIKPLEPIEGLDVDCIHGSNVATIDRVSFSKDEDFPDGPYDLQYGDGDGTVNTPSLAVCSHWKGKSSGVIKHVVLPNINHMGALENEEVLDHITTAMLENS